MSDCDKLKMQFSGYLDGDMPMNQRKEMDAHLAFCPKCADTLRQMKIIQDSLRRLSQIYTSPEFEHKLHDQIFNQPSRTSFFSLPLNNWKVPAMGSAIVLATVGLFMVFNEPTDMGQSNTANPIQQSAPRVEQQIKYAPGNQTVFNRSSSTLIQDSLHADSLGINRDGVQLVNEK